MSEPAGENICVSIRVRPMNKREEETAEKSAWRIIEGTNIVPTENNPRKDTGNQFAFGEEPTLFETADQSS